MKLGRVSGTVVSTISHPIFDHRRLLICDLLDDVGNAEVEARVRDQATELCRRFPVYRKS